MLDFFSFSFLKKNSVFRSFLVFFVLFRCFLIVLTFRCDLFEVICRFLRCL